MTLLIIILFSSTAFSQANNNQGKAQFINHKTTKTNPLYAYLDTDASPASTTPTITSFTNIEIKLPIKEVLEFINPEQIIFEEITIFNKKGKAVKTVKNNFHQINIKQLAIGKYWVEIWDGKQQHLLAFEK